ncbi:MAG: L-threonylcarbamoyladenylate synthase [Gemmatimonadetes bacterium]|nr:L-threonylcarbamoyladenylate synthase [Gemmatimonadota bacterium]MDA1104329.1 L-threonylcarbamoyladenylate synthase [Gemmatimonadota bacterium]
MTVGLSTMDLRADPDADLSEAVGHIRRGGVVAYPTETVYGLGGACTVEGVRNVRAVKGRSEARPLIALIESRQAAAELEWTDAARELAEIFWPGGLTLVLRDPKATFPPGVRDPVSGGVAVRVTSHPVAARLIAAVGGPLTSTSLNSPGERPAMSGHEARDVLTRFGADVWLLDAGPLPESGPSTVVDCTTGEPIVLREGTVPIARLRCAIPGIHE